MIPKKIPDKWHPCSDNHALNVVTKPIHYPIPFLQYILVSLYGKALIFKLDLLRAYHHIPVHSVDVLKAVLITLFGFFNIVRMPCRLHNAS